MYILIASFIKEPAEVAKHAEAHRAWVDKYFNQGVFFAAGPKKSKLGGAILARSMDKSQLLKIMQEDVYVTEDLVEYQIVDLDCKVLHKDLSLLAS